MSGNHFLQVTLTNNLKNTKSIEVKTNEHVKYEISVINSSR